VIVVDLKFVAEGADLMVATANVLIMIFCWPLVRWIQSVAKQKWLLY